MRGSDRRERAWAAAALAAALLVLSPPAPADAAVPRRFDETVAMSHVRRLASFGARVAGSAAESRAVDYAARTLRSYGYTVTLQRVTLPKGRHSHNVVAIRKGRVPRRYVIGAHIDSRYPSPGANDNGSGSAVALELARDFAGRDVTPTLVFVLFGAEERAGDMAWQHHYGSKRYLASLTTAQRSAVNGMVSVDMVGFGTSFHVRTMDRGPQSLRRSLLSFGSAGGYRVSYLRDTARYGSSDHEPFELAGIPAAWLEWRDDPLYHTRADVPSHVSAVRVRQTGYFLRSYLASRRS